MRSGFISAFELGFCHSVQRLADAIDSSFADSGVGIRCAATRADCSAFRASSGSPL
jgi:hypothetical protein